MNKVTQPFFEFCDLIHAAHPRCSVFRYSKKHLLDILTPYNDGLRRGFLADKGVGLLYSDVPCPDFGLDDLEYTIEPKHVWKVPTMDDYAHEIWALYDDKWVPGEFIACWKGKFFVDLSRDIKPMVDYCVLADPENPERKPDDDWRPE